MVMDTGALTSLEGWAAFARPPSSKLNNSVTTALRRRPTPSKPSPSSLKNTSAMDPLRQDITAILEECYSRGMQLPYLFVAVSLDGRVMGVRFTEAEDGQGLDAQPIAGNPNALATMPMPINVMIVDATGQANCALISGPGQVTFRYS
jgi:hypothetical protein